MKIQNNFSNMRQAPVQTILTVLMCAALLMLFVSIKLGIAAYRYREDSTDLQNTKTKLAERVAAMGKMKPESLPGGNELEKFKNDVASVGRLNINKGLNPSLVLSKLERLLPNPAYLVNIQYQRETGDIMLVAESRHAAPLALFLYQLEQDKSFSEILLLRQLQEGEGNKKRIQYSIKLTGKQL